MEPTTSNTVIDTDTSLVGPTVGHLTVRSGATLMIDGEHTGSVELESGAELDVLGTLRGRLDVGSLATARIAGALIGGVDVRVAGTLVIESAGSISGPVTNFGSFTNLGKREGRVEGRTPDDRAGSQN